ncbi:MAG TPA: surface-adhesin E family protein [Syntrophorhabdaceae bacterium]|nr:surface-adhesin E family protein [Syntrophorhabdaceae bacterium]
MNSLLKTAGMICFGILISCVFRLTWAAEWTLYYQADTEKEGLTVTERYYIDTSAVQKPQKEIVRFTQRMTATWPGREEADKKITRMEINCSSRRYRVLSATEYDDAGKAPNEVIIDNAPWASFTLDSVMGILRDQLCFEKKQPKPQDKRPDKEPAK